MKYAYAIAAAVPVVLAELHDVTVGDDRQLQFDPQVVTAAVGDQVRFTFYPDHDVAQGAFSSPCTPSDGGFYSGRLNFTDNTNLDAEATQQFTIDVTNTDPIWYYCTTAQHCQSGMVGGINIPYEPLLYALHHMIDRLIDQTVITPSTRTLRQLRQHQEMYDPRERW
ncbi:hypothetical protein EJ05DRAFT_472263 [Pseudovirgaria hyperparasitica]|uniref:Cupredoxin n=1 Tax=Pseudovirgaria hyperparasitica TaxID=470096 RepID=A0A6A6WMJ9_9PEZI|nr:uncharacterized protein EJ05DRAFT_472263 [Pseudovirgaria hyperparasitica]KAF2763356.1 hypothetical protein EJ05DRAFT_472263 [Pseudovirgaria hyperparasitica]